MNSRERVIRAIEMSGPDRIPIVHSTLAGAFTRYGERLNGLYMKYPSDVISLGATGKGEFSGKAGVESTDAWGATWISTTDDYKGYVTRPILETWDDFDDFHPPSPIVDPEDLALAREAIRRNKGEESATADADTLSPIRESQEMASLAGEAIGLDKGERYVAVDGDTLWQRMFYLRGFGNIALDLLVNKDKARALRDMILDFMLERIKIWLELEVDGFILRDDWGSQDSLMINPDLWREFFKPAYKEISDLIHSAGRHFWFHSDGYIRAIIPDMIEIGVDVVNPQVSIMGIKELGREFGGKICFLGDIDRQRILPFGTPAEVRECVRETIEALGTFNGGYIGRGEVAPDVPLENVRAMFEAFIEFGTYPKLGHLSVVSKSP